MRRSRGLTLILLLIAAAHAPAATKVVHFNMHIGIADALLRGNVAHLKKESKIAKVPWKRVVARLAYLESTMRLQKVITDGQRCFERGKARKKLGLIVYCPTFAASAALADQRVAQWAHIGAIVQSFVYPVLEQITGSAVKLVFFHNFDLEKFLNVPPPYMKRNDTNTFIPWQHHCTIPGKMAKALVKLNGKTVCMAIDTASPSLLTSETAKRIGAKLYKGTYGFTSTRLANQPQRNQLAVVRKAKIGNITIANLPFRVVHGLHVNIIGNDVLHRLGGVQLFTRRGLKIAINRKGQCEDPMAFALKDYLLLGPTLEAVVNGKSIRLLFDSGQVVPLETNVKNLIDAQDISSSKPKAAEDAFKHIETIYYTRATFSSSLRQASHDVTLAYEPNAHYPVPVTAGFGLLGIYNVELDWQSHKSCFVLADES